MKNLIKFTLTILALTLALNVFAQDTNSESHSVTITIPEVALLDLEGSTSLTLAPTAPTEAGNPFDFSTATSSAIWINYSSVVASGNTRTVTAAITTGSVPTGMELTVSPGSYSGSGQGTLGTAVGSPVTLSGTSQNVVTGIGSCWTGNGESSGHNLTYQLDLVSSDNYDDLVQGSTSITITYTLTEDG